MASTACTVSRPGVGAPDAKGLCYSASRGHLWLRGLALLRHTHGA